MMTSTTRTLLAFSGLLVAATAFAQDATLPAVPKRYTKGDSSKVVTNTQSSSPLLQASDAMLPAVPKRYTKGDTSRIVTEPRSSSAIAPPSDSTLPAVPKR
jgi:hypothetical protein